MKFQVPQFIDTEDKLFYSLSFKEFIYLVGGAGLSYVIYRFVDPFFLALLLIFPVLGFSFLLAFYKVNNKPFIEVLQSGIKYFIGNKLYIWKKENKPVPTKEVDVSIKSGTSFNVPVVRQSKLSSLNFTLDVKNKKE